MMPSSIYNTISQPPPGLYAELTKDLGELRGGAENVVETATQALTRRIPETLQSLTTWSPCGVLALTFIASLMLIPLTQVQTSYGFTVGYGVSMAVLGLFLRQTLLTSTAAFGYADVLSAAMVAYGLRLASYLLIRDWSGNSPSKKEALQMRRIKRVPFAVSLALFYSFLATPVLYVLRSPVTSGWKFVVAWLGTAVACTGVVAETVADAHKFYKKSHSVDKDGKLFDGPVRGLYSLTRHPNYTAELLFYFGCFVAGLPSFGTSVVAYLAAGSGLAGIFSVMNNAADQLEKKQESKYSRDKRFKEWHEKTQWSLIPYLK